MKNAARIIAIMLVLLMALALIPMAAWAVEDHEHVYDEEFTVDVAATCISQGSKSRHCTVEGCTAKTDETAVPATGEHSYAEEFAVDQAPTCVAAGSKSRHCTTEGCNARTEETTIPATGEHSFTAKTATDAYLKSAATCQSPHDLLQELRRLRPELRGHGTGGDLYGRRARCPHVQ